jgi:hypothetical protein
MFKHMKMMLDGQNVLNLKEKHNIVPECDKDTDQIVRVVMLVTCVWKVPGSDLGCDTEVFHGFPLSLQINAGTAS